MKKTTVPELMDTPVVGISEIIAMVSLIVLLFPAIVFFVSSIYMGTFFGTSGINLNIIPVSISDSFYIFKKYLPISCFFIVLLCIFTAFTLTFSLGNTQPAVKH